jgi:hypothetical protein
VPPVTAAELALAALVLWIVGWALLAARRAPRSARALAVAALVLGILAWGLTAWLGRPLALAGGGSPARLSPHGRAPAVATLEAGTAVRPIERRAGWLLVEGPGGQRGWLPSASVASVVPGRE